MKITPECQKGHLHNSRSKFYNIRTTIDICTSYVVSGHCPDNSKDYSCHEKSDSISTKVLYLYAIFKVINIMRKFYFLR